MGIKLSRRLRGERGEVGIIPVIAGSAMFLVATIGIVSTLTLTLGASAMSQTNSELTASLRAHIQNWQQTPWPNIEAGGDNAVELHWGARTFTAAQEISFVPELNGYTLTIAAPRAVAPGVTAPDCTPALATKVPGCITLSGTIAASPNDTKPETPPGITLSTEQVGTDGASLNLISNAGFETDDLSGWTITPTEAAAIETVPARAFGSHSLVIDGGSTPTSVTSASTPVTAGDELNISGWARPNSSAGAITIGYTATLRDGNTLTADLATLDATTSMSWTATNVTFTAPPQAAAISFHATVGAGITPCDTGCSWVLDDISLVRVHSNLVPDSDLEGQPTTWVATPGSSIATGSNRTGNGTHLIELHGDNATATSAETPVVDGAEYKATAWVKNAGPAGAPGSVHLTGTINGIVTEFAAQSITSLNGWTKLQGTLTMPAGSANVAMGILTTGADPSSIILADDITLYQMTNPTGSAGVGDQITIAHITPSELTLAAAGQPIALRASFKYVGSGTAPTDLKVALYCTTSGYTDELISNDMVALNNPDTGDTWLWARIDLPDLSRIDNCTNPTLRVYSKSGAALTTTELGTIFVFRVLPGITTGSAQ